MDEGAGGPSGEPFTVGSLVTLIDPLGRQKPSEAGLLLQGEDKTLPVQYHGQDTDTLRDLKVVVITGRFYAGTGDFEGEAVSMIPNYGFVAAAYISGIISTLLFLFLMERKLRLLYMEVKEARLYEPEVMDFDKE